MLLSELAKRDIAILGAGREGQAAWRWLRLHFPEKKISVYQEAPGAAGPKELRDDPNTALVNGAFATDQLAQHELLIRSPGISPYRSDLAALRQDGTRFTSASNLWFANHPDAKTVCITGTKGKSTTAALTAHLLNAAGLKVELAGNIGRPLLDCDADSDWWVIELSSYQLVDLEAAPTVAAILNLSDEHLDWHGGSRSYRTDKLRIVGLAGDAPLVANGADESLAGELAGLANVRWFGIPEAYRVSDNELWRGGERISGLPREYLPGPHNLANLAAALTILEQVGIEPEDLQGSLASFRGLPHRLQSLREIGGVRYVNDSLSTTPVATLAALCALEGERVILLVGGMDRGLDWQPMMQQMKQYAPHAVICLPDNGQYIAETMQNAGLSPVAGIQCAADLGQAMALAAGMASPGDTVLLSPGAPSFPHFRDFEDRGDRFASLAEINKETAGVG